MFGLVLRSPSRGHRPASLVLATVSGVLYCPVASSSCCKNIVPQLRTNYNDKMQLKTSIMYALAYIFIKRYAFVSRREGTMTDAVGKRIRRLREKQGLTLRALATKARVPTSSINAVEQGTR